MRIPALGPLTKEGSVHRRVREKRKVREPCHFTSVQEGSRFETDPVTLQHQRKALSDTTKTTYIKRSLLSSFCSLVYILGSIVTDIMFVCQYKNNL